MSVTVLPTSSTTARISLKGLEPGETLNFIYSAQVEGHARRIEDNPIQTVAGDGSFTYDIRGLRPLPGSAINKWQVQVVHKRGVACAEVILP